MDVMSKCTRCAPPPLHHCISPRPMATAVQGAPTPPATTATALATPPPPPHQPQCAFLFWRSFPVTKGPTQVEVDATGRAGDGVQGDGGDWPRVTA